jgi:signal transduction histidine kinase
MRRDLIGLVMCCILSVMGQGVCAQETRATSDGKPLEQITLQLKWRHQFQFAGYYAAIEKGYFREAGLEVTLKEATPGMNPADVVASGEAEYGISTTQLVIDRAGGRPIVAMAAVFQHSPTMVMALASSGIASPQELRGKRLMLTGPTDPEVVSMLRNEGVGVDQVRFLPHTWNIEDLIAGRTDAMTVYSTNEPYLMQQRGIAVTLINPLAYGIDFYGDCLFTSQKETGEHPQRVTAFLEASRRGWVYAMSHQEEIADLIIARYNPQKTREQLLFEASAMEKVILADLIEIGHMNPWRWRRIADQYAALGLLPANYPLDDFLFSPPKPWLERNASALTYAAVSVVVTGTLVVLVLVLFNRRLKLAVEGQTAMLRENEVRLRAAAEEAQAANQAKDRFLARLSHELRTPLTPVLAVLSSMESDDHSSADSQEDMRMMRRNVELEARLIDDLLDLTRITHGRLTMDMQTVDAHEMVRRALRISQDEARGKHQQVQVELAAVEHHVRADPARLQQVFWNVIRNAIRYTPEGGTITIRSDDSDGPEDRQLVVRVRDTGIGISPEMLPMVFNAFEKACSLPARCVGGLGLGMTIARSVMERHGGQIAVASEGPGRGATFTITMPVAQAAAEASPAVSPSRPRPAQRHQSLRILLVEDHPNTRTIMSRLLSNLGHDVVTAASVEAGIKEGLSGRFDLLLSDLGLPDGSGYDVMAALRDQPQLHAIAFSGYGMEADVERSREAGFGAHLVKPVDMHTLCSTIEAVCGEVAGV